MATLKNGILNGFSGKIGAVVGYQVGDNFFIRSLPKARKNFTEKERINQAKFKLVQNYLHPFADVLKVGFRNYYTKTGGFRAALAFTRKEALKGDDDTFYIDPTVLKISGGLLEQAINPQVVFSEDLEVLISWHTTGINSKNEADQLMLLIYDSENMNALTKVFNGAFRKDGSLKVKLKDNMQGVKLDIYIGFVAADRSAQSDSQYLGTFEV
ncbi:DUF6266 family protein [Pedobacter sp. Leaf176]|uniref:DUF6266 family protein n=1 Tax=Pedobacter sp. Leaf176 TaxID=1736286 RepID=UPI0006FF83B9|nr:DUF6266 family protein [Pedobacter sp. Leaf176]KQR70230.1 hypothetical protein ASF92_09535 [Pedobacter sp. Leaf176]